MKYFGDFDVARRHFEQSNNYEARRNARIAEQDQSPSPSNNMLRRTVGAGLAILAIAGGAFVATRPHEKSEVISETACVTSPKAISGSTKWDLSHKTLPNLDALPSSAVTIETSGSQDGILRPGDTVEVCVPLQDFALARKPTN